MLHSLRALALMVSLLLVSREASSKPQATSAAVSSNQPVVVIGFVGGFVRHDDRVHTEVQLLERLREGYTSSVYVQLFENHRGKQAHQAILRLLHANREDALSPEEKQNARIII